MTIDNMRDIIDSRDIIERIEELRAERAALVADIEAAKEAGEELVAELAIAERALSDWDASDDASELRALEALAEQCEGYGDWEYGEALIRRSYFRDYAEELAEDIGAVDRNASWPMRHIDWDAAARDLEHDYTSVDFEGVEYLMRA